MAMDLRLGVCGLALAFVLPAQQAQRRVVASTRVCIVHCPDLSRFDEGAPTGRPKALSRLLEVLRSAPMGDAPARSLMLSEGATPSEEPVVLARGAPAQIELFQASLARLAHSDPGASRLHFSIVTMPIAVAKAHQLEPGRTVMTDDATWSGLLRDAVEAKGRLHNLPEVITGFLTPYRHEPTAAKDATDCDLERLQAEVVPLDDGAIAVAIELTRKSKTGNQPTVLAQPVFRLTAGQAAMMAAVDGDRVVVVIARCIETGIPSK